MALSTRAVFLDKDGTLVENIPYNVNPDLIRLTPFAGEALRTLCERGYSLFLVSNQAGVAEGFFAESALQLVAEKIHSLLAEYKVGLQDFYYCPHHPEGKLREYAIHCNCRKPAPGMLREAARKHAIDLAHSWMIGDILHDVEAGRRAGCRTVLIDNGSETEWRSAAWRTPHLIAPDLQMAARAIVEADKA